MMKNIPYSLVAILVVVTCLPSCSPVPYGNVGQNVPMLKHKGEVSLSGSFASTDDASGAGFQAAVAVDSSLALMGSVYSLTNNENTDWQGSGRYSELGIGRYAVIRGSDFVYDVLGGVGFGRIANKDGAGSSLNINFVKPFVQGSIGLTTKWIEVALTSRLALPVYTGHENGMTDPGDRAEAEAYFEDNKSKFVFEPGINFRFGYKNVKASLSYCTSTFSLDGKYDNISVNNNYLGAGLTVLISNRYNQGN